MVDGFKSNGCCTSAAWRLEKAPVAVIAVNRHHACVEANEAACALYGLTREQILGKRDDELVPVELETHEIEPWASYKNVEVVRSDGGTFWVDASLVLGDEDGHRLYWLVDVTDRQSLRKELERQNRLEAVGRMAGGIAHDFNNLLTAILSFADLQMQAPEVSQATRRYAISIQAAAERAAEITKQLLAFCKGQATSVGLVDLNEVVRQSAILVQRLIGERISLELELAPALPSVRADQTQLIQVVMNLAVNARDAMPHGGRLVLKTGADKCSAGRNVSLRVQDSGAGIAPETLPHIFDPFFTTKASGRGTGLGLATVRSIVKQNHGEIAVKTELGKGTSFEITLPVAVDKALETKARICAWTEEP